MSFICNQLRADGFTTILKEGYEVEFCDLPLTLPVNLNGKSGKVVSISAFPDVSISTSLQIDNEEHVTTVVVKSHYVKFKSGNGYDKVIFIGQMPNNPDYIGERIVSGYMEGGSSNGCPAFLVAFDPATWSDEKKKWIRANMEIQSNADTESAIQIIQNIEKQLTRDEEISDKSS